MRTSRAGNSLRSRDWSARAGFTLIEVVIVVLLIGIVTAVTVPNLSALLAGTPLDRSVDTVVEALRAERLEAVRTGVPRQLWVTTEGTVRSARAEIRLPVGFGVRSARSDAVVTFYPTGLSSGAAWRIAGDAGESRVVRVSSLESAITVEP